MMDNFRYTNETCPVCNKNFAENDDIVVCPLCGTPHHRDCYKKNGECGNAEKHNEGYIWEPTVAPLAKEEEEKPEIPQNFQGGAENQPIPVSIDFQFQNPLSAYPPEFQSGIKTIDEAAYIQKGAPSFLNKFFLEESGKKTFNFWAFLLRGYWFIYRKMYKLGALFLAITLALSIIPLFVPQCVSLSNEMNEISKKSQNLDYSNIDEAQQQVNDIYSSMFNAMKNHPVGVAVAIVTDLAQLALAIYCGIIANRKYKEHVEREISKINASAQTEDLRRHRISTEGGASFGYAVLACLGVQVLVSVISLISSFLIK